MPVKGSYATNCKRGHPYSGDNLYVRPDNKRRHCRACWRAYRRTPAGLKTARKASARYHARHPDKERERYRRYYQANKERVRAYHKERYRAAPKGATP